MKKLFSCLLIIDDFAEDKTFMRYSKILHGLYTKSRHFGLSVITAVQKYNALAPIVRLNTSSLYIFKLKNMSEVDTFIMEQSALVDKQTLMKIYQMAVNDQPFSFLFVKLYVGHTTNFAKRKHHHKNLCQNTNNRGFHRFLYQFLRENGGWENWDMILITTECCMNGLEAVSKAKTYRNFESIIEPTKTTHNQRRRTHV